MTGIARSTDDQQAQKLDELDRLLNDPDEPIMRPARVWSLLAELTAHDLARAPTRPHITR